MDSCRGEKRDPCVVVLAVVPAEELCTEGPGIFYGTKPGGELRPVLECFELRFRVRVVI